MEYTFHHVAGRNISIRAHEASRTTGFEHGLSYSSVPLVPWKPFTVTLSHVSKGWKGGLAFGVVACKPEDLPVSSIQPSAFYPYGLDEKLCRHNVPFSVMLDITKPTRQVCRNSGRTKLESRCPIPGYMDTITLILTDSGKVYFRVNDCGVEELANFSDKDGTVRNNLYVMLDITASTLALRCHAMPSLMQRCRTVIRQSLNSHCVDSLPLPSSILRYLQFLPRRVLDGETALAI